MKRGASNFDYIAEARAIAGFLGPERADARAEIEEAIAYSATGTEILFGVRFALKRLLRIHKELMPELVEKIERYMAQTDPFLE